MLFLKTIFNSSTKFILKKCPIHPKISQKRFPKKFTFKKLPSKYIFWWLKPPEYKFDGSEWS